MLAATSPYGIDPHRVALHEEADEAFRLGVRDHVGREPGGHLPGDVLELAVLDPEPLEHADVVEVEALGEEGRELGSVVARQARVGDDHPAVDRSASGSPLRSRISPRVAGRITSTDPSAAAISAYSSGSTPCSCTEPGREHRQHHRDEDEPDLEPQLRRRAQRTPGRTGSARSGHIQNLGG